MIEFAMFFAVGVLAASLVALLIGPLVARRARRTALADLQRRMPMTMAEITAQRDAQRAAHALEIRRLEQRIDKGEARWTASRTESGRQIARLVTLDTRHAADQATIATLENGLDEARQAIHVAEATVAAQVTALEQATALADQRRDLLDGAHARVSTMEAMVADQRGLLQELEGRLIDAPAPVPVPAAAPPQALAGPQEPVDGGEAAAQWHVSLTRLRAEQDLTRKALTAATGERDRLRLRIDELLLRIEELDDSVEEAAEQVAERRRQSVRQAKAIETLTARLSARDGALAALRQQLAEAQTASAPRRRKPADAAELREAVAALAADLVGFATTGGGDIASEAIAGRGHEPSDAAPGPPTAP